VKFNITKHTQQREVQHNETHTTAWSST